VTYSARGFQEKIVDAVEQTVGHTRTLDVVLSVAGAVAHVEVSDVGDQFDRTSDMLGARIEKEQVKQLPLNGRNWSTLTALVPGAVDTGGSNQRSIRFAGRGLDDNNFTYDGIDATNIVIRRSSRLCVWLFRPKRLKNFASTRCCSPPRTEAHREDRSP
jgi:hypothetical protein